MRVRSKALVALDLFGKKYGVKYEKGVACLTKDKDALLAFHDFPAEHWGHLRTSNPIELERRRKGRPLCSSCSSMEGLEIYTVELYRKDREACADGMSKRAAARHFNISRDSVDKI